MKNGKPNGKVVVETGASKGIGAEIAEQFATEGAPRSSIVVDRYQRVSRQNSP
ncbi:MAG TPA: hypothetical protein VGI41_02095 [Candidatus Udaeobacter sp.]|jgi:NAD(P)-dependent dehydrogenase (short-subunit alcohol dehydrogenase family)